MIRIEQFQPAELAGTLHLTQPLSGIGRYRDIYGTAWDVSAIIGRTVCACPVSQLHPHFTDTSGAVYRMVHQRWQPYEVEVHSKATA